MPLRKKILIAGVALITLGAVLTTWFLVKRHGGGDGWQIAVEGNRILSERDVQEVVSYLLKAAKDGVSSDEIRDALLLNPRIAMAKVTVLPGRRVNITINERQLEYLQNEENGVAEKDASGTTIVENAAVLHQDLTPDKVIFYLTFGGESSVSPKRDIIRLWKETREKYAFLWQRFAEIEIRPLKGGSVAEEAADDPKKGKTPQADGTLWRYRIYSAGIRSCIVYEGRLSEETLRRLWAVYAYLETKLPRSVTLVDLQENSAIIREMKQSQNKAEADT
ncbi:MAG: FtsQ-type POTRA domain-containing protein [Spirochaetes bacterium]|nr:FtsQ-type POTRA domain-containing protein [Spirochaetota bacterium]